MNVKESWTSFAKIKKLVVFFYPKASTPGCTVEACNLNDNFERFKAQGYNILGVSAQFVVQDLLGLI